MKAEMNFDNIGGSSRSYSGEWVYHHTNNKSITIDFEPDAVVFFEDRNADDWSCHWVKGNYEATTTPIESKYTTMNSSYACYLSVSGKVITLNMSSSNWDNTTFKIYAFKL